MPIPKTSGQTIAYTAAIAIREGLSEEAAIERIRQVHSYLSDTQAFEAYVAGFESLERAKELGVLGVAGLGSGVNLSGTEAQATHFVEVLVTQKMSDGSTEHRTIRVPVEDGAAAADVYADASDLYDEIIGDDADAYYGETTSGAPSFSAIMVM